MVRSTFRILKISNNFRWSPIYYTLSTLLLFVIKGIVAHGLFLQILANRELII